MRELQRQIDHDNKLQVFLGTKGQKRVMKDLEEMELKKRELEQDNIEKEVAKQQRMLREIQVEMVFVSLIEMQRFCLQEFIGEEDVNKLASQFVKQEEENFALFNYVNELNHEIEIIGASIDSLRENIGNRVGSIRQSDNNAQVLYYIHRVTARNEILLLIPTRL